MNKRLSGVDKSLNMPTNNSEGETSSSEAMEYLADERPSQELVISNLQEVKNRRNILVNALSTLNEREVYIIKERKLKDSPTTLDDLSQHFGISKERVRQIESRAFEKLQEYALSSI